LSSKPRAVEKGGESGLFFSNRHGSAAGRQSRMILGKKDEILLLRKESIKTPPKGKHQEHACRKNPSRENRGSSYGSRLRHRREKRYG